MKTPIAFSLIFCICLANSTLTAQEYIVYADWGGGTVAQNDSFIVIAEWAGPFYGSAQNDSILVLTSDYPLPDLFASGPTSTKDMALLTDVRVYPNPTQQSLFLNRDSDKNALTIQMLNSTGLLLHETEWNTGLSMQLELRRLPDGIYFVSVVDREGLKANVYKVTKF